MKFLISSTSDKLYKDGKNSSTKDFGSLKQLMDWCEEQGHEVIIITEDKQNELEVYDDYRE